MDILLRQATILDQRSPLHGKKKDILISSGKILKIADSIKAPDKAKLIESENLYVSSSWMDSWAYLGEPGEEQKETIETGLNAAAIGGFGHVMSLPNTSPTASNATQIKYQLSKAQGHITTLLPIGSLSQDNKGQKLAEMMDMYHHGAIAFSDGLSPMQDASLFMRAMEYLSAQQIPVMQMPIEEKIDQRGLMNEGENSAYLGMSGIPDIGEKLMVYRDIDIAEYTDSPIHIAGISSKLALDLLKKSKKKNPKISLSVSPFHLLYTDDTLKSYNSNFKLHLPLRTESDRKALVKAINEGSIDAVSSFHLPVHEEGKEVEFNFAEAGMISFQTLLPMLLESGVDIAILGEVLANNPKRIFNIENPKFEEGSVANMTVFDPNLTWIFDKNTNLSLSNNSNLLDKELKGKVLGLIQNKKTTFKK